MLFNTVTATDYNESFIRLTSDDSIERELWSFFTFKIPNAQFNPLYKKGKWSGEIKLYSLREKTIYKGLIPYIEKFCDERGYRFENKLADDAEDSYSLVEIINFLKEIKISLKPRDYQIKNIAHCLRRRRAVILSPTGSGKSFTIYSMLRFLQGSRGKKLLIVPSTHLVDQMYRDFKNYAVNDSWKVELECSKFMGGTKKEDLNDIIIGTWQSVIMQPKDWLEQFDTVIVDECHGAKAKSLITILEGCVNARHRIGFTGTLDGSNINKLVLEGLFGLVENVTTTKELMDKGYLAELKIRCLLLNYHPEVARKVPKKYPDEIKFLIENDARNEFIANLAASLKGNTLILYLYVEKHGEILKDMISQVTDKKVYFIHGGVNTEDREKYRHEIEAGTDSVIVASYGVYSQGVNITNINNIIFASPSKSRIRNLQSIGRGLRLNADKTHCTLFDIADDLSSGSRQNYSLKHFFERIKIYNGEKFDYKINKIKIK